MTARVQPSDIVQGLEAGADSLTKPVDDLALITPRPQSRPSEDAERRVPDAFRDAAELFRVDAGPPLAITASVGVASLEHPSDIPVTLLRRADRALYTAKRAGRNRVVIGAA